jgi:hypothetical protein
MPEEAEYNRQDRLNELLDDPLCDEAASASPSASALSLGRTGSNAAQITSAERFLPPVMMDATIGSAPVEVMDDQSLHNGISVRVRWALAVVVSLIALHDDTDSITDTADAAVLHLEARDSKRRARRYSELVGAWTGGYELKPSIGRLPMCQFQLSS